MTSKSRAPRQKPLSHDVIVCIHDGLDDVKVCLQSLLRHRDESVPGKIILIDDSSSLKTKLFLRKFDAAHDFVKLVELEGQNYYTRAANAGLRASRAEIRTLLNSDTIVTPGWAAGIRSAFALGPSVGIVGVLSNAASTQSLPFVKPTKEQTAINALPPGVPLQKFARFVTATAAGRIFPFVPLVHGFCFSVRQSLIDEIGYFDEVAFPKGYGEENDYCFRAEDAGFLLAVALNVFVFHAKSKSYTSSDRVSFMQNGMNKLVEKHGEPRISMAVNFMENNPHLQFMRRRVLEKWPEHFTPDKT